MYVWMGCCEEFLELSREIWVLVLNIILERKIIV